MTLRENKRKIGEDLVALDGIKRVVRVLEKFIKSLGKVWDAEEQRRRISSNSHLLLLLPPLEDLEEHEEQTAQSSLIFRSINSSIEVSLLYYSFLVSFFSGRL